MTQTLPSGGLGAVSSPAGCGAEPRRQTHFGNNLLKIGLKSGISQAKNWGGEHFIWRPHQAEAEKWGSGAEKWGAFPIALHPCLSDHKRKTCMGISILLKEGRAHNLTNSNRALAIQQRS